jgi:alkanesulfonate monooxygenase SsuD/methylene tetrahydromethanopterin reductase-like flavin-dependent oxidoreductase (luciferase family)
MTEFGYTAMCEQTPVRQLVSDLAAAEQAGFDFSVMSDHYFPWIEEQGHSGYAWSVLGAAAQATVQMPLMTFVTCPTFRYHPAIVAQKAATTGILSGGRFTLGLPARDTPVPIGIAVCGPESIQLASDYGDAMIATEPDSDLVSQYARAGGGVRPRYGQLPLCYGPDEAVCRARARELWRWALPGWHVMAELPDERSFAAASEQVTEDDVAGLVPCGPDTARRVEAARQWVEAGFTHLALAQVGADQQAGFIKWAESEFLPAGPRADGRRRGSRRGHHPPAGRGPGRVQHLLRHCWMCRRGLFAQYETTQVKGQGKGAARFGAGRCRSAASTAARSTHPSPPPGGGAAGLRGLPRQGRRLHQGHPPALSTIQPATTGFTRRS